MPCWGAPHDRPRDLHPHPAQHVDCGSRLPSFHKLWAEIASRFSQKVGPTAKAGPPPASAVLAECELAERDMRRIRRHLTKVPLPAGKTLATFDFKALPSLPRARVEALERVRQKWIPVLSSDTRKNKRSGSVRRFCHRQTDSGGRRLAGRRRQPHRPPLPKSGQFRHRQNPCSVRHPLPGRRMQAFAERGPCPGRSRATRVFYTRTSDLVQKRPVARRDLVLEAALAKLDRFDLTSAGGPSPGRRALPPPPRRHHPCPQGPGRDRRPLRTDRPALRMPQHRHRRAFPGRWATLQRLGSDLPGQSHDRRRHRPGSPVGANQWRLTGSLHHASILEMNAESFRQRAAAACKMAQGQASPTTTDDNQIEGAI